MIVPATAENIARAATALAAGDLVAFPTETVYGLGANARDAAALGRLFAAKGRPLEHPVIVHLAGTQALPRWARTVPAGASALAAAFWPGPLTLILPRAEGVLDAVTGGQDGVGLRVPAQPIARALLAQLATRGCDGIAAPSANRFGRISATTAKHVADEFGDTIALILDGGPSMHGIESTIVDFTGSDPVLLRPGSITSEALARVLGTMPRSAGQGETRAPGTLASHYAPGHGRSFCRAASCWRRSPGWAAPARTFRCSLTRSRNRPNSKVRGSMPPARARATRNSSTPTFARSTRARPTRSGSRHRPTVPTGSPSATV